MEREVLIHFEQVDKFYHMGEVVVEALKHVTFDIYDGELLCIIGPSGSGKSTLLNIIGGMDRPTSGSLFYEQKDMSQANEKELTVYRRNQVGFVFQFYNLIPDLTAEENVALAAELVENPFSVAKVLTDVDLLDRSHHFPSQLSGGEQQRVSIARAMVKNPRLLLCDEPTGALDYQTGKVVLETLKNINEKYGSTLIMVTHNSPIALMADRVIKMRSGEIAEIQVNAEPLPPERIEW